MPNGLTWFGTERVNTDTLIRKLGPKRMIRTEMSASQGALSLAQSIKKSAENLAYAHSEIKTLVAARRSQPGNTKSYDALIAEAKAEAVQRYNLPADLTWSGQELELANRIVDGHRPSWEKLRLYSGGMVVSIRGQRGDPDFYVGYPCSDCQVRA